VWHTVEAEGCVPAELGDEVEARRAELVERVSEVGVLGHVACELYWHCVLPTSLVAAACNS
jgi:hypothetical protein